VAASADVTEGADAAPVVGVSDGACPDDAVFDVVAGADFEGVPPLGTVAFGTG
jgi:hypothetical protein